MAKTAHSTTTPAPAQPGFIDPTRLPDEYAMRVRGDCLAPAINSGDSVLVDQRQPYAAGDLVCVFLKPECVAPGNTNVGLKRLVMNMMPGVTYPYQAHPDSNVMPVLVCEQDNPPLQYTIPADQILAIHRCMGRVPDDVALYDDKTGEPEYRRAASAGWSRRELLAGAISIVPAAGAAAIVAGTAPAIADEHPDAELLDLERQIEALIEPMARLHEIVEECSERFHAIYPPMPDALNYSGADWQAGLFSPDAVGRSWCGWSIETRMAELPNNPAAQKRLQELKAIHDQWWQAVKDAAEVSGHDPAIRELDKLWDQQDAIQQRAREIEPQTFEGLAVKARMVSFTAWHLLFEEPEEDQDWDPKVCRWFMADVMRLGGRDLLPTPWRAGETGGAQA